MHKLTKKQAQQLQGTVQKARNLYQNKDFNEALRFLNLLPEKVRDTEPVLMLAGACYFSMRALNESKNEFMKVHNLNPNNPDATFNLGVIERMQGNYETALKYLMLSLKDRQNHFLTYANLLEINTKMGHYHDALLNATKSLALKPDNIDILHKTLSLCEATKQKDIEQQIVVSVLATSKNKDLILDGLLNFFSQKKARYLPGLNLFLELRKTIGESSMLHFAVARLHFKLNNITNAHAELINSLNIDRKNTRTHLAMLDFFERTSNLSEMNHHLTKYKEEMKEISNERSYFQALYSFRNKDYDQVTSTLSGIDFNKLSLNYKIKYLQLRAEVEDKVGDPNLAYNFYKKMNEYSKKKYNISDAEEKSYLKWIASKSNQIKSSGAGSFRHRFPVYDYNGNDISFLIGFPRSGTTLLETFLGSHTQIATTDEIPTVANMHQRLEKLGFDFFETFPDASQRAQLIKKFKDLSKLTNPLAYERPLTIEKMPLNMVHIQFIEFLFHGAPLIFSVRHPYDVILSNFKQNFALNPAMACMTRLESAVQLYCVAMENFVTFKEELSPRLHFVKYEALIENKDQELRQLFKFLDLPWEATVSDNVQAARNRGAISTPSYKQVTQPVYNSSVHSWKKYKEHILKFSNALERWVDYFGYQNEDFYPDN